MSDDRIELHNLEDLARVSAEGNQQVLEQLCSECVQFLYESGVPRDRIPLIATPAIVKAYRQWLAEHAEPAWAAIERDIVGATQH